MGNLTQTRDPQGVTGMKNLCPLLLVLFMGMKLIPVRAYEDDFDIDRMKRQSPFKLCGNQLVGMLNLLCSIKFDAKLHGNFEDYFQNVLLNMEMIIQLMIICMFSEHIVTVLISAMYFHL